MIRSKGELKYYLKEDRKSLCMPHLSLLGVIKDFFFPNEIWKFTKRLRYLEYYSNTKGRNPVKWGGYYCIKYYIGGHH